MPANRLASHCPMKGPFSPGRICGNRETRGHVSGHPVPASRSRPRSPAHSALCSLWGSGAR